MMTNESRLTVAVDEKLKQMGELLPSYDGSTQTDPPQIADIHNF